MRSDTKRDHTVPIAHRYSSNVNAAGAIAGAGAPGGAAAAAVAHAADMASKSKRTCARIALAVAYTFVAAKASTSSSVQKKGELSVSGNAAMCWLKRLSAPRSFSCTSMSARTSSSTRLTRASISCFTSGKTACSFNVSVDSVAASGTDTSVEPRRM